MNRKDQIAVQRARLKVLTLVTTVSSALAVATGLGQEPVVALAFLCLAALQWSRAEYAAQRIKQLRHTAQAGAAATPLDRRR